MSKTEIHKHEKKIYLKKWDNENNYWSRFVKYQYSLEKIIRLYLKTILSKIKEDVSNSRTSGYTMNANPAPWSTTDATGTASSWARKPITEKITKPAKKDVPMLLTATINESL